MCGGGGLLGQVMCTCRDGSLSMLLCFRTATTDTPIVFPMEKNIVLHVLQVLIFKFLTSLFALKYSFIENEEFFLIKNLQIIIITHYFANYEM